MSLFDSGVGIVEAVALLPEPERARVARWAAGFTSHPAAPEWVEGHLSRGPGLADRAALVLERIDEVARLEV